ncbi:MAG TPA: hypothetical protein VIL71_09825 [Spirillospora sp.]
MNVEERVRRVAGVQRGAAHQAPRSGGRTVARRAARPGIGSVAGRDARDWGVREFPTQGSVALRPRVEAEQPARDWEESASRRRPAATRPPRLRVAPPPPVARPHAPFVALILLLVVGGVAGILVVQTKVNENAFRLDQLREQQVALNLEEQRLRKEIAEHEAPGNLVAEALKLGLVRSGPPAFIRLPDGRVIGVPQPAQGEPSITSQRGG